MFALAIVITAIVNMGLGAGALKQQTLYTLCAVAFNVGSCALVYFVDSPLSALAPGYWVLGIFGGVYFFLFSGLLNLENRSSNRAMIEVDQVVTPLN